MKRGYDLLNTNLITSNLSAPRFETSSRYRRVGNFVRSFYDTRYKALIFKHDGKLDRN